MAIIIDVIILGFIILGGFIGYKKGLSNIVINIVGVILALILGFVFKGTLANFIEEKTNIGSTMKTTISEGISSAIKVKAQDVIENVVNPGEQIAEDENVQVESEQITEGENVQAEGDQTEVGDQQVTEEETEVENSFYASLVEKMHITDGVDAIAEKVVKFILETASFIIIFVVVYLCVFILKMMLNLVFKLPILSNINGIGGLIANTVISIIQVWVVLAILSFMSPMLTGVTDMINSTIITKALYEINLIVLILSGDLKF